MPAKPKVVPKEPSKVSKSQASSVPKRPKSSYLFFCSEKRVEIKRANSNMKAKEIVSECARLWRELSAAEKKPYEDAAEGDRVRYALEIEEIKEEEEEREELTAPPVKKPPKPKTPEQPKKLKGKKNAADDEEKPKRGRRKC